MSRPSSQFFASMTWAITAGEPYSRKMSGSKEADSSGAVTTAEYRPGSKRGMFCAQVAPASSEDADLGYRL